MGFAAAILAMVLLFAGCGQTETKTESSTAASETEDETLVHVLALKGPTSMGMVKMMSDNDSKESPADTFELAAAPDEVSAKLVQGEVDIAAVPANLASVLYNKTNGGVQVLAVNTLGVLYIVEDGDTVHSIADLKGRTIYAGGKGATPEYALNYILEKNGLVPGEDVTIEWKSEHCDLNCGVAFLHLPKAYEDGLVSEEAITAAVERLMEIRIRLGMMKDYPSPYEDLSYDLVECKEHVDLSVEAARRSMVLLKNENNMLPLDVKKIRSIAVIGPNANSRAALVGNYQGTSSRYITPLEGIQQYVGDDVRVTYAEGCHLYKNKVEGLGEDKDRFKEAVIAAEHADVVVLCLGLDATVEGEEGDAGNEYASGDKLGLNLPGLQEELLETITAVGKPVVLVLSAGSAIDLSWAEEHVPAILDSWYPGARGGKAVAEALFGDYAPNGKLPVTFYQGTENLPEFTDYSMAGRTYRYTDKNILYPFGYGLTYGTISYSGAKTEQETSAVLDDVTVCTKVKNESVYPLHESVEVYVKYKNAQPDEPGFQLKGIACVELQAGEEKEVSVTLHARDFAVITEDGGCVVRPGEYEISIGGQQPGERSRALTGRETEILTVRKEGNEENVEY